MDACNMPHPLTIDHVWHVLSRLCDIADTAACTNADVLSCIDARVGEHLLRQEQQMRALAQGR
eukprot:14180739-Alexandrium_andersonii.AAC.1